MKICMLIPRFYPVMGGTENQCRILSKALLKMGHSVFVLTQREKNSEAREMLEGLEIHRMPGWALPHLFSFGFFFSALFFLFTNRAKYDLIHVHLATSSALAAVFAAAVLGKGCVIKFAGAGATGDIGTASARLWGRLKLFILRKSRAICTAPSVEVVSELLGAGFRTEAVVKIANGVDSSFYSPLASEARETLRKEMGWNGKKVFLFAGRLEAPKDIAFFIKAWAESSGEEGLFVIAGSGSEEKSLKALAEKNKIKNIVFAGKINDIRRFYRAADFFVLPSRAEGLSNALLEAMSCALIPIAGDIPSSREIIEPGSDGLLFSFDRPEDLRRIIKGIFAGDIALSSVKRMGDAARFKITGSYSIESAAEDYVSKAYGLFKERGKMVYNRAG